MTGFLRSFPISQRPTKQTSKQKQQSSPGPFHRTNMGPWTFLSEPLWGPAGWPGGVP